MILLTEFLVCREINKYQVSFFLKKNTKHNTSEASVIMTHWQRNTREQKEERKQDRGEEYLRSTSFPDLSP